MTNEEAKILIDKYNKGQASSFEAALLQYWFIHEASQNETALNEQELQQMVAGMRKEVLVQTKPAIRKLWPRVAAVAAAVAMVVFGVWFFNYRGEVLRDALDDNSVVVNDVAPGTNGATITLGNGKVIQLSDAKSGVVIGEDRLAYNDGSEIDNSSLSRSDIPPRGGESSAVAKTAKGQTYIFTLPDGTKVWLNAASTLTIPSGFSGTDARKVELTGEAYFEVVKNKKLPFIVESKGQEVTVLGTHFNINSYADEGAVKTTLLEGSVSVRHTEFFSSVNDSDRSSRGVSPFISASRNRKAALQDPDRFKQDDKGYGEAVVLKPNQQSVVSASNQIIVKEADTEDVMAWKNGYFRFNNKKIADIMLQLSRWYDIEIKFSGKMTEEGLYGKISRYKNISDVLKMLEKTGLVRFEVEGRRIIVKN